MRDFQGPDRNYCLNPKPVHTTASIPSDWSTVNATNSTYTYSDGGTYHGRTTKHIHIEGNAGCSTSAGMQLKDRVASECAEGDYYYVGAVLGETTLTGCTLRWRVAWFTAADALISADNGTSFTPGTAFAEHGQVFGPAPATTDKCRVYLAAAGDFEVGDIQEYSIAEVIVTKVKVRVPWFDGDTTSCSWEGSADASASLRTKSILKFDPLSATLPAEGTLLARIKAPQASTGVALAGPLLVIGAGTAPHAQIYWNGAGTFACQAAGQTVSKAAAAFAKDDILIVIGRWDASGVYIDIDAEHGETLAATGPGAAVDHIGVGMRAAADTDVIYWAKGYIGPVIVSEECKSDTWVEAMQGTGILDDADLIGPLLTDGDALVMLESDGNMQRWVGTPADI